MKYFYRTRDRPGQSLSSNQQERRKNLNKHIKRVAFILLTTVVCFLTACTDVVQPVMAAIVGDSNEFNTDNNRAFISNEELGRIVSYDGYISKAEYMAHQPHLRSDEHLRKCALVCVSSPGQSAVCNASRHLQ